MTKNTLSLFAIALSFLSFAVFNTALFSGIRLDLTEHQLFTLSEGTHQIIDSMDEPVHLYFFFSDKESRELTGLRAYAKQVDALLREYEHAAEGKILLHKIDPEPFSEEEDQAAAFELQSIPLNNASLYFGLAGENTAGQKLVIPFIQPDKETFLEYEISKLLQGLIQTKKPVVGLLSSITVRADMNMQTFQTVPAWMLIQQLEQLFEVKNVEADAEQISEDIDLLVIIHPKDLGQEMLLNIDQFVMAGGRLLAFVDPFPERDRQASANPMMPGPQPSASNINALIEPWGVSLREGVVLGDAEAALSVAGPNGEAVRHLGIVGMISSNFSSEDVVISSLENINFSSAGILDISDAVSTKITTLISSSASAAPIETARLQFLADPADLQKDFNPTGERFALGVRLSGKANSAFPDQLGEEGLKSTEEMNVIVISDTDVLTDQLWVQVQNFFGQSIANPWANNGDFVVNAVDNLLGSSALIGIRSRGEFTRPFDVVASLQREAEANFQKSADELQARLSETEQQLASLEAPQGETGMVTLSPEQEAALTKFQDEKLKIRKELREVRHQLDRDINSLGATLKLLNIVIIPIVLTFLLIMFNGILIRNRKKSV